MDRAEAIARIVVMLVEANERHQAQRAAERHRSRTMVGAFYARNLAAAYHPHRTKD